MDLGGTLVSARNLANGSEEGVELESLVALGMDGEVGPAGKSPLLFGDAVSEFVDDDNGFVDVVDGDEAAEGTWEEDGDFLPKMPERKLEEDLEEAIFVLISVMASLDDDVAP